MKEEALVELASYSKPVGNIWEQAQSTLTWYMIGKYDEPAQSKVRALIKSLKEETLIALITGDF